MNVGSLIVCILLIAVAALTAIYIPDRKQPHLGSRIPSLLELSVPLFLLGIAMAPQALPAIFTNVLGHSLASQYAHPERTDGITVTETWVLARWWGPIGTIFYLTIGIGIAWAVWNIWWNQGRKLNIFALCCGLVWASVGAFIVIRSLPF